MKTLAAFVSAPTSAPAAARAGARAPGRQPPRGATLVVALVALVILLIGATAIVRSMNTSMFNTGNQAFKRDLTNQAERAAADVMVMLQTGALATEAARRDPSLANNYSSTILPTNNNSQGIPNVLTSDTAFAAAGYTLADRVVAGQEITLRWVLDRLCANTGVADETHCTMTEAGSASADSFSQRQSAANASSTGLGAVQRQVVYRLSIRATGPRNTQSFLQTTFTL
jgi:Tfp pilus assembly protein PilX